MCPRLNNLPVLMTLIVLFAVLPGFITALVFADRQRQQALTNVQLQNISYLRLVALNQSQIVANTRGILTLLASSPDVQERNRAGCENLLDQIVRTSGRLDGLAVADEERKLWCFSPILKAPQPASAIITPTSTPPPIGRTVTISEGLQNVTRTYERARDTKDFTIGEYFIGGFTTRPYLSLVQPVVDAGSQLTGFIVAGLSLDAMNAAIQSLDLPEGYVVAVLDREGTFLVRWPTPSLVGQNVVDYPFAQRVLSEATDGKEHTMQMTGVDGITRLYAFQSVPGTPSHDLFVVVGIAPELAYARINNDLRQYLALLTLFTILAGLLAWTYGRRRIVEPIQKIAESTQKIGEGALSTRVQLVSPTEELNTLAQNFNAMAARMEQNTREIQQRAEDLNQANSKLELRVEQRTQQLQNTVNRLRDSREQLRQLSIQQRRVVEAEQTRIAREVHDQIGQALTSLKIDVSAIRKKLGAAFPAALAEVAPRLAGMDAELDQTIQTARSISRSLRPTALDTLGLVAAMEVFAQEFHARTGIQCDVTVEGDDQALPADVATAVYRIMQEATTNVVRHAQATQVGIALSIHEQHVQLNVQDNGVGMSQDKLARLTSLGVLGMQERAREFGGTLAISSDEGKGTTLVATLMQPGNTPPG